MTYKIIKIQSIIYKWVIFKLMANFHVNYTYIVTSRYIPVFKDSKKNTLKPLLYIGFHKNLTQLSTTTFTFLKNWIFILNSSSTQVDCKISCHSQKYTYIYTIFQIFNLLKKHLQTPFIYRVSQKTDETFHNHVYIAQNLNLHSTT